MSRNRRIFHHYLELEETKVGFWRMVSGPDLSKFVEASSDLMRCPEEFMDAMRNALQRWPNSCEAAFTAESMNRIAFLGQAACCVAVGSPEGCTRIAWHSLTKDERDEANRCAAIVLTEWALGYSQMGQGDMFHA